MQHHPVGQQQGLLEVGPRRGSFPKYSIEGADRIRRCGAGLAKSRFQALGPIVLAIAIQFLSRSPGPNQIVPAAGLGNAPPPLGGLLGPAAMRFHLTKKVLRARSVDERLKTIFGEGQTRYRSTQVLQSSQGRIALIAGSFV